jgi:hypothetical protein
MSSNEIYVSTDVEADGPILSKDSARRSLTRSSATTIPGTVRGAGGRDS